MKKLIAVITMLFTLSGCGVTELFITSGALTAIDWAQTKYIANHPSQYYEKNPILGKHPSIKAVNIYFAFWILTNWAIKEWVPEKYSKPYFYIYNTVEGLTIINNVAKGIGMAL